jgi:hypothetical protein
MGKAIKRKAKGSNNDRNRRSVITRSSPTGRLSPAGAKIISAFNEAIETMRSGEPLEKRFSAMPREDTVYVLLTGKASVLARRAAGDRAIDEFRILQYAWLNEHSLIDA